MNMIAKMQLMIYVENLGVGAPLPNSYLIFHLFFSIFSIFCRTTTALTCRSF